MTVEIGPAQRFGDIRIVRHPEMATADEWTDDGPTPLVIEVVLYHRAEPDDAPDRRIAIFDANGGPYPYYSRLVDNIGPAEARRLAEMLLAAANAVDDAPDLEAASLYAVIEHHCPKPERLTDQALCQLLDAVADLEWDLRHEWTGRGLGD